MLIKILQNQFCVTIKQSWPELIAEKKESKKKEGKQRKKLRKLIREFQFYIISNVLG
jgi:hypothetical protein